MVDIELKGNEAILFDLDGVLVNSMACIIRHWQRWADRHQIEYERIWSVAHGRRTIDIIGMIAPHLDAETEAGIIAQGESEDVDGLEKIDGARELLESLPPGRWAVATSGSTAIATRRLRHLELPMPAVLVSADHVTRGKPDPEPYLMAAEKLGVDPTRCVVVEDAPAGIEAARRGGMRVIGVAFSHKPEELSAADAVADRLSDIHIETANSGNGALDVFVRTNGWNRAM